MVNGIIGRKIGMTQLFDERGEVVPVTVVEAGPCYVTQVKTLERDGYQAVQLGFGAAKHLNAPARGHLKKLPPLRYLREFRADDASTLAVGDKVDVGIFEPGQVVDVVGTSKGKGFAGTVKRHHFSGGPKTHGQSDRWRTPGSIGAGTSPGKVWKGMRMAGRMGQDRVSVLNLRVVSTDADRNLLVIRGAIPGPRGALVLVRRAVKVRSRATK